ncbi:MAG: SpoIID/LytB domain-containing protein [Elusimicrobia bacterium]|nr:SpoIID/LytB domain-containing protein [Elusimicrobiota bacterium]
MRRGVPWGSAACLLVAISAVSPARPETALPSLDLPDGIIRIAILQEGSYAALSAMGTYRAVDLKTGETRILSERHVYQVAPNLMGGIRLGPWNFHSPVRLMPQQPEHHLRIDGRSYRDSVLVRLDPPKKMTLINELGMESYLYGVLPHELSSSWPLEALKAQAVVSRTFAYRNLGKYWQQGFDLSADTFSQMYLGKNSEDPLTNRAVDETQGEVLLYRRELLNALFHACCGGRTRAAATAWGEGGTVSGPLSGVRDPYCRTSPHYTWSLFLTLSEIRDGLRRAGYPTEGFYALRLGDRGPSGYLLHVRALGKSFGESIPAHRFRNLFGENRVRSVFITRIYREGEGYRLIGRGWGHGVGMCQWGARAQAEQGRGYREILKFYYPGTILKSL